MNIPQAWNSAQLLLLVLVVFSPRLIRTAPRIPYLLVASACLAEIFLQRIVWITDSYIDDAMLLRLLVIILQNIPLLLLLTAVFWHAGAPRLRRQGGSADHHS